MKLKAVPNEGHQQPIGYVAESRVEANHLVTTDPEFVAEAETLNVLDVLIWTKAIGP